MKNDVCNVAVLLMFVSLLLLGAGPVFGSTDDPNFIARNPYPADGEINVSVEPNLTLTWDIGDANTEGYTIEYDVYYGTDQNEVETSTNPPVIGIEATSHTLSGLEHETEYFWRIDTRETYWDPDNFPPIVTFRIIQGNVWSFTTGPAPPRVITVDDDGSADFNNIQAAIHDSNDGDTVLVADGTYTGHRNRNIDIRGKTITVKSENGPENCIIDAEHFARVFEVYHEAADSILDGFTIVRGTPKSPVLTWYGGAIAGSLTIRNCIFVANYADFGGAIYGDPTIINCVFSDNEASCLGSAICCDSATIVNCTISNNLSTSVWGDAAAVTCSGYTTIVNSILWSNEICQIAGSPTVMYSDVQGGWPGDGNIDADPCFADPNNGDYHLKSQGGRYEPTEGRWTIDDVTSPCIDAGDPMTPIGQEPFPNGGIINMGGYGGTKEASKSYFGQPLCETIMAGDVNGDCEINFEDFRLMALHWCEEW